jgi:hypothetical protein
MRGGKYIHYFNLLLFVSLIFTLSSFTYDKWSEIDANYDWTDTFKFIKFSMNGFAVLHPSWVDTEQKAKDVELSVAGGPCSVVVNEEKTSAKKWYLSMVDKVKNDKGSKIIFNDEENLRLKYNSRYSNSSFDFDLGVFDCNNYANVVLITCVSGYDAEGEKLSKKVFNSVSCQNA